MRNKSRAVGGGMQSTEVSHVVAAVNIVFCAALSRATPSGAYWYVSAVSL